METINQEASSLKAALDNMPVGISWATLDNQKFVFMNRRFTELFGYDLEDFTCINGWLQRAYPFPEDRALAAEKWDACSRLPEQSITNAALELRIRCKDGAMKTVLRSGIVLPGTNWALATYIDITSRKQDEQRIQAAERRAREGQAIYQLLIDNSRDITVILPFHGSPRYVSPAVEQLTGLSAEEFLAHNFEDLIHPDDRMAMTLAITGLRRGARSGVYQCRTRHKNGSYRWVEATTSTYADPTTQQAAGIVTIVRDIAEQKKREEDMASELSQLSEAATIDDLTGIANRRRFQQMLLAESSRQLRSTRDLSLLLIDVDHFKQYNDLYGHPAGDQCLRLIAQTLASVLRRDADLPARIGGEEFVAVMPMTAIEGAEVMAQQFLEAIADLKLEHKGSPLGRVSASVGVASWPAGLPLDRDRLMQQADEALYVAKGSGRNTYRLQSEDRVTVVGHS
jgi:diguanylate cyclase (GGDEF)-like protein/PAS domain S-box-containing protein